MSRWGPKRSTSVSPVPPSSSSTGNFPYEDEPDFELVDTIEWGPDDASPLDELAARPKPDRNDDPCGCTRPSDPNALACCDLSCVLFACLEECRSSCEAGDQCGNKRIQRQQWKKLEVVKAGKKGKGLIVLEDCKKGDFVTEYVGRAVNRRFLPNLFRRYVNERKLYIMALDTNVYLDARKKGGVARYINHSCEPNCVVERWKVRGYMRAAVIANKDIPAGTELSFDYQWERKRGRAPTKCYCEAPKCRGTLEVPRSMEEEALERKLSTHWKKPLILRAGKEIVNRCIRVFSNETQEYFVADVTSYDEKNGKHLVMYRHDLEEVWEDLKKEDWMILDEEAEQYIIRKKEPASSSGRSLLEGTNLSNAPQMLLQGQVGKNYIFVQTPIKEAMYSKHLIERCQQSCRVTITPRQFAKPPLPPDETNAEEMDKYGALENSVDGTVWRLLIVGSDISKAHNILEKNVAYLEKQLLMAPDPNAPTTATGATQQQRSNDQVCEVILPRSTVESMKRRLPPLREKCRSVNFSFLPSESKSKQFSKLLLEASLQSDLDSAKDHLWKQLLAACQECNVQQSLSGLYRDLGFLGGELSSSSFQRLVEGDNTTPTASGGRNQDAKEDLSRRSPFIASFETAQRCTVWVQSDADKGRIDGSNRVVNEAAPNAPRKLYFGCDPNVLPTLWGLVKHRANEVERGVKYVYLGPDRLYQPLMMRNGGQFFEFVRETTGASVTVDSMTGDHLRIDGRGSTSETITIDGDLPEGISEGERAMLAEELIRLQIELYRDHCIRQQNWIFGRDWTLARRSNTQNANSEDESANPGHRPATLQPRRLAFDSRNMAQACLEIAEVVSALELEGTTAAHATVILYRFATIMSSPGAAESQLKMRELELACIFLANKTHKTNKWKRLDAVLEAAYKVFYAGSNFDSSKEEALVWADKIIAAETEVAETLSYDVFWRGFDWIVAAAIDNGKVERRLAREVVKFSTSGPVLGAGADLWLTYGGEYVFAAAAGFLDVDLEKLFPALSLIPFKVQQAAETILASMKITSFGKVHSSHRLFREGKEGLEKRIPAIRQICSHSMATFVPGYRMDQVGETEQRYRLLGQRNKIRRIFNGVEPSIVKELIMPALDGIVADSNCSIYLEKDTDPSQRIVLEGSWRALSIASYLLQQAVGGRCQLVPAANGQTEAEAQSSIQAKAEPGLLQMQKIDALEGWTDTIQSEVSNQSHWGRKTGGKSCVPAKIKESDLRRGGLRWWIPPRYGPSPTGTICDMFLVNNAYSGTIQSLTDITRAFEGASSAFNMLSSMLKEKRPEIGATDRFVAVSLQRWPAEKVSKREQASEKKVEKSKGQKTKRAWKIGFSPAALQEMQILHTIHGLIRSPQGHPNFILPIGVALHSEPNDSESLGLAPLGTKSAELRKIDEDIYSLTRTSLENEVAAEKERKRKDMVTGPHLVFHPTPFVLQRFISRKRKRDQDGQNSSISPTVFAAWVHDLLSALVHCHTNDIILRHFLGEQVVVDHSGVAKLGSFYRATVLTKEDKKVDILKAAKARKKDSHKSKHDDEDILTNPYVPPEMLLGSPKFTKETDIWSIGCLLCHLLLGKPAYSGKDRQSLLTATYKMVGIPSSENFPLGRKFPYYRKHEGKKYVPGMVKALTTMMTDEEAARHAGAIDLISKMLQLDPKDRITAVESLQHEYMQTHFENCNSTQFQQEFAQDWMSLKKRLMRSNKTEEDEVKERERGIKRKAMLLAASKTMNSEDDDLYDMDDILHDGTAPKKAKP